MVDQEPIDPMLDDLEAEFDEDDEQEQQRRSRGIVSVVIAIIIVIIVLLMLRDCGGSERAGRDDDSRSITGAPESSYEKGYVAIWLKPGQDLRAVLKKAGVPFSGAIDMGDDTWVIAVTPGTEKEAAALIRNAGVWDADLVWRDGDSGISVQLERGTGSDKETDDSAENDSSGSLFSGTLTEADLQALSKAESESVSPQVTAPEETEEPVIPDSGTETEPSVETSPAP